MKTDICISFLYYFDEANRLVKVKDPLNNETEYSYDGAGNQLTTKDARSKITTNEYDSRNRLIKIINALNKETSYAYDGVGNRIAMTDANNKTTNFYYDALNRLIETKNALDLSVFYGYDANSNKTCDTDANGNITVFKFDKFNRLTEVQNAKADTTGYEYNVLGNKTISYTYDANGNRLTMTDGENGVTNYTYDDIDRLTRIQNPDYENTDYTYGDAGEKLLQTNANGTRTEYFYDDLYRLVLMANKKSNGDTISSFSYNYDNSGNRLSKIYENGDTEIYSYDNLYQLTKVETKDKTTEYNYDKVGNRMQMKIFNTEDTEVTEYFYNSDNQLLSYNVNGTDTVSFIYDPNGNQIFKITASDTVKYDYDYDNNLLCVSAANDTNIISYIYSPDGKRLKKYLNGIGTKYFYDADDVLTEYDTNTTVQVRYTNNLGIDDIISSKRNSITECYHKDALGSIVNLTDNTQNTTVSYRYNVFGSIESQSNSHQNEYTYTGRQIDREAGLYYYRSRYYNSEIGRFIKKDKLIFFRKIINHQNYIYVNNNPILYFDYDGFCLKETKIYYNVPEPNSYRKETIDMNGVTFNDNRCPSKTAVYMSGSAFRIYYNEVDMELINYIPECPNEKCPDGEKHILQNHGEKNILNWIIEGVANCLPYTII